MFSKPLPVLPVFVSARNYVSNDGSMTANIANFGCTILPGRRRGGTIVAFEGERRLLPRNATIVAFALNSGCCAFCVEGVLELLGKGEFFEVDNPYAAIAMPVE